MKKTIGLLVALGFIGLLAVALSWGSSGWVSDWSSDDVVLSQIVALRGSRVLSAALTGACLGVAGALMQTLLANELADPYVLGMSAAAALGAVGSSLFFPVLHPGWLAGASAWLASWLVRHGITSNTSTAATLVRGMLLGTFLGAWTGLLLFLAPDTTRQRAAQNWLFGGLHAANEIELLSLAVVLTLGCTWTWYRWRQLDQLLCGPDVAQTLGTPVVSLIRQLQQIAAAMTAVAVVAGGLIGCVGWIAPHLARTLVGASHRHFVAAAAGLGAAVLVLADLLARTLASPRELPVGLLTGILIAPLIFVWRRRELLW